MLIAPMRASFPGRMSSFTVATRFVAESTMKPAATSPRG
jgi:hypothetical protein